MRQFTEEELALLDAIHSDPRNDAPRLVYADWLAEHGEPEYAEFLRLELRPLEEWHTINPESDLTRQDTLLQAHGSRWCQPYPASLRGTYRTEIPSYDRGLPFASLGQPHSLAEKLGLIREASPRFRFIVLVPDDHIEEALSLIATKRVKALGVVPRYTLNPSDRGYISPPVIHSLANAPHLNTVERMTFSRLSDEARELWQEILEPRFPRD